MASFPTFRSFFALLALASLALAPRPAGAAGFGLFQHGGRGIAQVGALTGRADDPSAVTYNPAGITRLKGLQFQAGLYFALAEDEYLQVAGPFINSFSATRHTKVSPALYLTWKPQESPWALGVGLDAPFWNSTDWQRGLFSRATETRRFKLELFELHPVLAYAVDERWSVALGFRYLQGDMEDAHRAGLIPTIPRLRFTDPYVYGEHTSKADVDGWGYDLALHYDRPAWGWGAVVRSAAKLDGTSRNSVLFTGRVPPAQANDMQAALRFLEANPARLEFELPPELRIGFWRAPYPELRIELDLAYAAWSEVDNSVERPSTPPTCRSGEGCAGPTLDRRWKNRLSARAGVEGNLTRRSSLSGGVAYEPSPARDSVRDPGFPRGNAYVYGIGWSYEFPRLSFDLGYSYHKHERNTIAVRDKYPASEQVFAFAVRWR